jgi:hypothetical protein
MTPGTLPVALDVGPIDVARRLLGLAEPELRGVLLDRSDHLLSARGGEGQPVAQAGKAGVQRFLVADQAPQGRIVPVDRAGGEQLQRNSSSE